jgi:hypothetical protein
VRALIAEAPDSLVGDTLAVIQRMRDMEMQEAFRGHPFARRTGTRSRATHEVAHRVATLPAAEAHAAWGRALTLAASFGLERLARDLAAFAPVVEALTTVRQHEASTPAN